MNAVVVSVADENADEKVSVWVEDEFLVNVSVRSVEWLLISSAVAAEVRTNSVGLLSFGSRAGAGALAAKPEEGWLCE